MRRQYHFRPNGDAYDAWDVRHLIELAAALPVTEVAVSSIAELDTPYWFGADGGPVTVRILVRHMELVGAADCSFPVILAASGQVMDGMHRIARCLLEGRPTVPAVRFAVDPPPDHVHVRPDDLDYD